MDPQASSDDGADSEAGLPGADDSFGFGMSASWTLSGELPAGADLGGVTILRLLAQGGMGRVYEARQERPRRKVAVKVIREGVVPAAAGARLLREAETLAALRHPHIAQIHTCGTAPAAYGGAPFLVMELVEGARSITRFAAARGLSIRARVALFRRVCDAVAHGHRHGVVHRDLKPANILVDTHGEPKVIDYGIARARPGEEVGEQGSGTAAGADVTTAGSVVGTLRYMSPEQVLSPAAQPDARSDVYALGLILHELLAGRLPYDLAGKSIAEAARVLGTGSAPGTAVVERAALAVESRDDARALAVIVAKCLEPLPSERYAEAADVAADLGRWLDGRPISARPPTPLESLRRLARRHRVAAGAVAALGVTLIVAALAASLLSVRLERQRREARAAEGRAETEAAAARDQLYASTMLLAAAARDRDNLGEARHLLEEARGLVPASAGPRPIEISCLEASLDDAVGVPVHSQDTVTAVAWSPDGHLLAAGDRAGVVRLCAARTPFESQRILEPRSGGVWAVAFSPDGRLLAVAAGDGDVMLHDVGTGVPMRRFTGRRETVYAVAFSPDGTRMATGSRDRTARIWDVASGREVAVLDGHEGTVYAVAFTPNGESLITGAHDGAVRVWDVGTGAMRSMLHGHEDRVFAVSAAPDGRTVASAAEDGTVRIWDLADGGESLRLTHPTRVNAVAFAVDGGRIATAAMDGMVRIWDAGRGKEIEHLRGHAAAAWCVAWGRGGLATGGADGDVRVWDPDHRSDVLPAGSRVLSAAYSPDGRTLATGSDDAQIRLWDAATLEKRDAIGPAVGRVNGVAWSPAGDLLAGACDDGMLFVWDAAALERVVEVQAHTRRVYAVAFAPDGSRVATASEDRTVAVRDPRTGDAAGPVLQHPRRVFCAAFTADGEGIATACEDRVVRLWEARGGVETARLVGHEGPVNWVAFAPDGVRLASASSDGTVRLWNLRSGAVERVLAGPARQVWKVAFSPDGRRVAAAAADGSVHVWDAASGRPASVLRGHRDQVWSIAFAPDGGSLVSGSWDGTARIWGVSPAEIARRRAGNDR